MLYRDSIFQGAHSHWKSSPWCLIRLARTLQRLRWTIMRTTASSGVLSGHTAWAWTLTLPWTPATGSRRSKQHWGRLLLTWITSPRRSVEVSYYNRIVRWALRFLKWLATRRLNSFVRPITNTFQCDIQMYSNKNIIREYSVYWSKGRMSNVTEIMVIICSLEFFETLTLVCEHGTTWPGLCGSGFVGMPWSPCIEYCQSAVSEAIVFWF